MVLSQTIQMQVRWGGQQGKTTTFKYVLKNVQSSLREAISDAGLKQRRKERHPFDVQSKEQIKMLKHLSDDAFLSFVT